MVRFGGRRLVTPPRGSILAVAAVAAAAALPAGASPTGTDGLDAALRAVFAAGVAAAAANAGGPAVLLAGALAVAVLTRATSSVAVMAPTATAVALAVVLAGRSAPPLLAVAGGLLAQVVLRLEWPVVLGAPTAAAAAVVAPVLVLGLARAAPADRRHVARAVGLAGTVAVVGVVAGVVAAMGSAAAVEDGMRAARSGLDAVADVDRDRAREDLHLAAERFGRAEATMGAWWALPARVVPVVGQHARAVHTLADAGSELAAAAALALDEADPDRIRPEDGTVDLAALRSLREPVEATLATLQRTRRRLDEVRSPWLVDPLRDRMAELDRRVRSSTSRAETAAMAVRVAPGMLGGDGPRRYFLAVLTPAEQRGGGGFMGNWGEITAVDGRLELTRFGRLNDLDRLEDAEARRLSGPPGYLRRYGRFGPARYWGVVNMSPDFPTVAGVIGELYPQSGGDPIDGVVAVDPIALAGLLKVLGPVEVAGWPTPLTAKNADEVLLHEQYRAFASAADREERVDFLGEASRAVWSRLVTGAAPAPTELAAALGPAVDGRHLQLHSFHPAEQRLFARLGATGAVPPLEGDSLGVVTQNFGGNKIDWFLRRSYRYDVRWDPRRGDVDASLEITLRNEAPSSGLPDAVIAYGGRVNGDQPTTRPGENLLDLVVYTPHAVVEATLDGRPFDLRAERELGRNVYSALVWVPPEGRATVSMRLTGTLDPAEAYRLDVWSQATVEPDRLEAALAVPPGWRVTGRDGFRRTSPTVVEATTSVVGERSLRARAFPFHEE